MLNGKRLLWEDMRLSIPQELILSPLLFLTYINNLPNGLNSIVKLFDDTSLFSVVHSIIESSLQWKTSFNPDPRSNKTSSRDHFQCQPPSPRPSTRKKS